MTTHDGGVPEATTTGGAFVARIGAENNGHTRGGAPDPPGPPTIDDEHDSEQGHAPEQHHGQLRFAERFCGQHGDSFLHAHGVGWHEFDGTRWAPCLDGAETRAMLATIKKALAELPHLDKRDRDQLYGDISKVESRTGLVGALALAGDLHPCAIAAAALDRDPYLLNTASGTVDLRTGLPRVADPADHLSKVTVGRFDPGCGTGGWTTRSRVSTHPSPSPPLPVSISSTPTCWPGSWPTRTWCSPGVGG
ncbi:MAG: hypothetical protein ACRD0V_02190 [Acidimicrobiales bacterium]